MSIPFPEYSKIKDCCLLAYFGNSLDYLIQLKMLRPSIEQELTGINIYICCRDEAMYLMENESRIIPKSRFKSIRSKFSFIKEITCNMQTHPIEDLLLESNIPIKSADITNKISDGRCVVSYKGMSPTRSLSEKQILQVESLIRSRNYEPEYVDDFNAEWVVGVESELLMRAASKGSKITLVPNGIGTNLVKKLIPLCEIFDPDGISN